MNSRSLCRAVVAFLLICSFGVACSSVDDAGPEYISSSPQAQLPARDCKTRAFEFSALPQPPAGVAGGSRVVFIGSPFEGRVIALDRQTRAEIGSLPTPPEGFILPYILRSIDDQRIAVLDAGGLPSPLPFVPANPRIYEYEYHYGQGGMFSATLTRTVSFASELIGFAEDIAPLSHGRYVLSDAVLGAIWVVERDGSIRPGLAPKSLEPEDRLFPLAFCPTMPEITVGGLPFLFSGSTLPGVAALASRGNTLYFYSPCARGLYSIPISSLFDHRQPYEKIGDVRPVSLATSDVPVEQLLGLTFNPFTPNDRYLYAADSLQLRVIRIDVTSGRRELVAADPHLFNFPSSAAFLPPVRGAAPLLVVSNQQHRTTLTNDAITEDMFEPPFLVTEVLVR